MLFCKNYIVCYNVYHNYFAIKSMCLPSFVLIGGWSYMLIYRNVCFLQEVQCYRIVYVLVSSELWVSITSPSFFALYLPVFNVLPEGIYCCFKKPLTTWHMPCMITLATQVQARASPVDNHNGPQLLHPEEGNGLTPQHTME